jgi:hypothetical protein
MLEKTDGKNPYTSQDESLDDSWEELKQVLKQQRDLLSGTDTSGKYKCTCIFKTRPKPDWREVHSLLSGMTPKACRTKISSSLRWSARCECYLACFSRSIDLEIYLL